MKKTDTFKHERKGGGPSLASNESKTEEPNWFHYSAKPLVLRDISPNSRAFKPQGLYCAKDSTWVEWCKEMGMFPGDYQWVYPISVSSTASIYKLERIQDATHWNKYVEDHYDGCWITQEVIQAAKDIWQPGQDSLAWIVGLDVETLVVWNATKLHVGKGVPWSYSELDSAEEEEQQ